MGENRCMLSPAGPDGRFMQEQKLICTPKPQVADKRLARYKRLPKRTGERKCSSQYRTRWTKSPAAPCKSKDGPHSPKPQVAAMRLARCERPTPLSTFQLHAQVL